MTSRSGDKTGHVGLLFITLLQKNYIVKGYMTREFHQRLFVVQMNIY